MNTQFQRLLLLIAVCALTVANGGCKKTSSSETAAPGPTSFKGQVYRTLGDGTIITFTSPDELEIRENGTNLICKYTKQADTVRIVANIIGTTQALYYKLTPEGLVGQNNLILYEPEAYQKAVKRSQLTQNLLAASARGDGNTLEDLFRQGATVQITDAQGNTPLWLAIQSGSNAAVSSLLNHGADPNNALRNGGSTPLMLAIDGPNPQIVQTLLEKGALPNIHDQFGNTALLLACEGNIAGPRNIASIINMLLDKRADPNLRGGNNTSPLEKVFNGIVSINENDDRAINLHIAVIDRLLKSGANPNVILSDVATRYSGPRYTKVLELLFQHGANPSMRDNDGRTPLMLALHLGHMDAVKVLIAAGADKTIRDKNGNDIWYYAGDDLSKRIALRNQKEIEDSKRVEAEFSRTIVGTWREEHSEVTYSADGTFFRQQSYGAKQRGKWSIDGDILITSFDYGAKTHTHLIEINATDLVEEYVPGAQSRAKRTSPAPKAISVPGPVSQPQLSPTPSADVTPPAAAAVDPKLIGAWLAKVTIPSGFLVLKWEQQADGRYTLSGGGSDTGTLSAQDGNIHRTSEVTHVTADVAYEFKGTSQLITTDPNDPGPVTWRRVGSTQPTTHARSQDGNADATPNFQRFVPRGIHF